MTLKQLAKLAETSISTVSKAFADSNEISDEKKEAIFALAKKHGCFEKYYKGRFGKKLISVICPELSSEFYAAFADRLNRKIEEKGGRMLLSVTGFSRAREEELVTFYTSYGHADGVIVVSGNNRPTHDSAIPVVYVGAEQKSAFADYINISNNQGIDEAVLHLKALGHQNIGFIGEALTTTKETIVKEALRRHKLPISDRFFIQEKSRFHKGGFCAMERLMTLPTPPTAVFAAYDYMAFGAMHYAGQKGIAIPKDVSLIGMDNVADSAFCAVPLTTIASHTEELCDIAADLIFKKIDNRFYFARQEIVLKSKLIIRNSTDVAKKEEMKK